MRPLYPTHIIPENDWSTRLALCALITVGTFAFFWSYDLTVNREAPFVPSVGMTRSAQGVDGIREQIARYQESAQDLARASADIAPIRDGGRGDTNIDRTGKTTITGLTKPLPSAAADAFASGASIPVASQPTKPDRSESKASSSAPAAAYRPRDYGAPD
jgi:hypothetical protein